jgi:predicted Zn-dependent peptidase
MTHKIYNTLFLLGSFLMLCFTGMAQSKQQPYELSISGVKVIVQPSGNDIVEIQTIIKGGVQNYPAKQAGIESLAFSALTECGTTKDDKNSFKNKLDKVSANVGGNAGMDYSTFTMNCIKSDFETVWPLYSDALTSPLFDKTEFERIKQDAINNLKAQASQPDYAISKYAREVAFKGKDYAKSPEGLEETVSALTVEQTKAFYKSILTKSRLLIVVVADIDRATIEKRVAALLENVPAGAPFILKRSEYHPQANSFKSEKKELATNYVQGITSAPLPGTPDFNAYKLAMTIFYDRQFLEVRTNNALSYAPYTYLDGGLSPSTNIVVSTKEPNKYIGVMSKLVEKTKAQGFTDEEVKNGKTLYVTSVYYRQETNSAQAGSLAANEVLHNNWKRAITLSDDMKKLKPADVNKAFNKYFGNVTWVYQGDTTKVNPSLYKINYKPINKLPKPTLEPVKKN